MSESPDRLSLKQILSWIIGIALAGLIPFFIASALAPEGERFTWILANADDTVVYISAINQGMNGRWIYNFIFSPEYIPPQPLEYLPYLVVGHIAWGDPTAVFHLFRIVCGLASGFALWFWARQAFESRDVGLLAFIFSLVGGGFGWLVLGLGGRVTPDINLPEFSFMLSLLTAPHFIIAFGLEALLMAAVFKMDEGLRWPVPVGIASGVLLGLFYPFAVPVMGLAIGIAALIRLIRDFSWRYVLKTGLILLPLALFLLYFGWIARIINPAWEQTHVVGNIIDSPSPINLLLGFGLMAVLGSIGLWRWIRAKRDPLIPLWLGANLLALYLPFPFAGRFALGMVIPAAALAAFGVEDWLIPKMGGSERIQLSSGSLRRMVVFLALPSVILALVLASQGSPQLTANLREGDLLAAEFLAEEAAADDIVLVHYPMGNYLPRLTEARMFMGQRFLTIDLDEKLALIQEFWSPETTDTWRMEFLDEWGITLIYYGSYESDAAGGELIVPPDTIVIYEKDGVIIYRVTE